MRKTEGQNGKSGARTFSTLKKGGKTSRTHEKLMAEKKVCLKLILAERFKIQNPETELLRRSHNVPSVRS